MKRIPMLGAAVLALAATPAMAQDSDADRAGDIQFKVLGTYVAPDGKITDINVNLPGLPATLNTEANDNFTPTVAIEWFVTNNISIETIAGVSATCVDVAVSGGTKQYCALSDGAVARFRGADIELDLISYAPVVDETLFDV